AGARLVLARTALGPGPLPGDRGAAGGHPGDAAGGTRPDHPPLDPPHPVRRRVLRGGAAPPHGGARRAAGGRAPAERAARPAARRRAAAAARRPCRNLITEGPPSSG